MLADNVVHFARLLRRAGLPVGPDRALTAIAALQIIGVQRRDDVHAALSAAMLGRRDEQALFDMAFDAFWRDAATPAGDMAPMIPEAGAGVATFAPARPTRLAEALAGARGVPEHRNASGETRFDAALGSSERERLQHADFQTMTTAEFALAQHVAATLPPPVRLVRQRRRQVSRRGTLDLQATLRRGARDPHTLQPVYTRARVLTPPIVVLLDISGSMERYARLFLHYAHGLVRRHIRVHVFAFGTRLTNITRCLRQRDPDQALTAANAAVPDWHGGTRIGACLDEFNRRWAGRVLGGNAAVLIVTDGLERDDTGLLAAAAHRLARTAHEVVWLNPLLRYAGFEPKAAGIRALRPHVDRLLPMYNLASLADLARALGDTAHGRPLAPDA
jgi:uncharacterized protein with von Willebrand factor type A (vWA) domain